MRLYAVRLGTVRHNFTPTGTVVEATGRYRTIEYAVTKAEALKKAKAVLKAATHKEGGWQVAEAYVPNRLGASEWAECLSFDCPGDAGFITFQDLVNLGEVVAQSKPQHKE